MEIIIYGIHGSIVKQKIGTKETAEFLGVTENNVYKISKHGWMCGRYYIARYSKDSTISMQLALLAIIKKQIIKKASKNTLRLLTELNRDIV